MQRGKGKMYYRVIGLLVLFPAVFAASAQAQDAWSVSPIDDLLREIDLATGTTVNQVVMTFAGQTIDKTTGLTAHPQTGELWGVLKLDGQFGHELVKIDHNTGVCTDIGNTGDKFAAIVFDDEGTLYGLTGNGAATESTLYTINTGNGSKTFLLALGNGEDGEALGYNPDDGMLYHGSGNGDPNRDEIFESIDLGTLAVTPIPLSGDDYNLTRSLSYDGNGAFYHAGPPLHRITTNGVVTFLTTIDHITKGIVLFPTANPDVQGDCDDDGDVDLDDYACFFACVLGPAQGLPAKCGPFDFDNDDDVDLEDFAGFQSAFRD